MLQPSAMPTSVSNSSSSTSSWPNGSRSCPGIQVRPGRAPLVGPDRLLGLAGPLALEPVDVEEAVEVVVLVLEHAREPARRGIRDLVAVEVETGERGGLATAQREGLARDREAALGLVAAGSGSPTTGLLADTNGLMTTPRGGTPSWLSICQVKMRSPTPTCGAASPTPRAASIVSNMSATSSRMPSSMTSTGSARRWSTGSPVMVMGRIVMWADSLRSPRDALPLRCAGTINLVRHSGSVPRPQRVRSDHEHVRQGQGLWRKVEPRTTPTRSRSTATRVSSGQATSPRARVSAPSTSDQGRDFLDERIGDNAEGDGRRSGDARAVLSPTGSPEGPDRAPRGRGLVVCWTFPVRGRAGQAPQARAYAGQVPQAGALRRRASPACRSRACRG